MLSVKFVEGGISGIGSSSNVKNDDGSESDSSSVSTDCSALNFETLFFDNFFEFVGGPFDVLSEGFLLTDLGTNV